MRDHAGSAHPRTSPCCRNWFPYDRMWRNGTSFGRCAAWFLVEQSLELECFDPHGFKDIRKNGVPSNASKTGWQLLPNIDRGKLKDELVSLATSWPLISKTDFRNAYDNLDEDNIEDEWTDVDFDKPQKCNKDETCKGESRRRSFCRAAWVWIHKYIFHGFFWCRAA